MSGRTVVRSLGRTAVLMLAVGCAGPAATPGRVVVRDAFVFEAARGGTAAGYAEIRNGTDSAETLDSITTDAAESTTPHGTRESNGLVSMVPMDHPAIAPHDTLAFRPGGAHLMLEGLGTDLRAGERLVMIFWFHRAGRIAVDAMVRPYGS